MSNFMKACPMVLEHLKNEARGLTVIKEEKLEMHS